MRKSRFCNVALALGVVLAVLSSGMAHAQTTIDEVLSSEARAIQERDAPRPKSAPIQEITQVSVLSVYGQGGNLHADISYNGIRKNHVDVGDKVGKCKVTAIVGACVSLESLNPVGKVARSKAANNSNSSLCPRTCWQAPLPPMAIATSGGVGSTLLNVPPGQGAITGTSGKPISAYRPLSPIPAANVIAR